MPRSLAKYATKEAMKTIKFILTGALLFLGGLVIFALDLIGVATIFQVGGPYNGWDYLWTVPLMVTAVVTFYGLGVWWFEEK